MYNDGDLNATVFFYEDHPYAGTGNEEDWKEAKIIMNACDLQLDIPVDLTNKVNTFEQVYLSQYEPAYRRSMVTRAMDIAIEAGNNLPRERIYRLAKEDFAMDVLKKVC